jgi:hypothetical protein
MEKRLKQHEEQLAQSDNEMKSKLEGVKNMQQTWEQKAKDLADERARAEASRLEQQANFEKRLEALSVRLFLHTTLI